MPDIFDKLKSKNGKDIFDQLSEDLKKKKEVKTFEKVDTVLDSFVTMLNAYAEFKKKEAAEKFTTDDILSLIKKQLEKTPPKVVEKVVGPSIEEIVKEQLSKNPPKIIREEIIKPVEKIKVDTSKYDELNKVIQGLKDEIKDLKEKSKEGKQVIVGSSYIPNQSDKAGKFLKTDGNQLSWDSPSGGSSSDAYTPTNVTTRTSFDADDTTLDEIADTLGSLIVSLQGAGIIQ